MPGLKEKYLDLLEKKEKTFPETLLSYFFLLLSGVYALAVSLRNFLFDKGIIFSGSCKAKVISMGNLSWSGSGKTSLVLWLYEKLSPQHKIAVLRRPYAKDEEKLLNAKVKDVFSVKDRYLAAKEKESSFDLFLLDDGLQYRRLKRDLNVVLMGAREFKGKYRMIPAGIFREPLACLMRADAVVVNYRDELESLPEVKTKILKYAPKAKVFFSKYEITGFRNLQGQLVKPESFKEEKLAALCGIGYPQGFFNLLKNYGIKIDRKLIFPDHHELSTRRYQQIQDSLSAQRINTVITTAKDRYHLPEAENRLNILIAEVEMKIDDQDGFLAQVRSCIK